MRAKEAERSEVFAGEHAERSDVPQAPKDAGLGYVE